MEPIANPQTGLAVVMRTSIYIGAPLLRAIEGYENRSGRLNSMAETYFRILENNKPDITRAEWEVAGEVFRNPPDDIGMAWAMIIDGGDRIEGLTELADIDALAAKVRKMPLVQVVALVELSRDPAQWGDA